MKRRFIILKEQLFIPQELKEYNNRRVKVEVIKEKIPGHFHVIFPNGYRTDYEGENHHLIIAWNRPDSNTTLKWWEECEDQEEENIIKCTACKKIIDIGEKNFIKLDGTFPLTSNYLCKECYTLVVAYIKSKEVME